MKRSSWTDGSELGKKCEGEVTIMRQWIWAIVLTLGWTTYGQAKIEIAKSSLCEGALRNAVLSYAPADYVFDETPLNGVLVELSTGTRAIAFGHYFTKGHEDIIRNLNRRYSIAKILWAGEVIVSGNQNRLNIHSANETSGTVEKLIGGMHRAIVDIGENVLIENSIENLRSLGGNAKLVFSPDTEFKVFDEDEQHLISELNSIPGNSRHSIGNTSMALSLYLDLFVDGRMMDEETADEFSGYLKKLVLFADMYRVHELPSLGAPIDHLVTVQNAIEDLEDALVFVQEGGRTFNATKAKEIDDVVMFLGQIMNGRSRLPIVFETGI